jgi:hypothetical protein
MAKARDVWRENSLTIVFGILFLLALAGQAISGFFEFNAEQKVHDAQPYSFGRYLVSSDFGVGIMENWQSEFLQFASFIALAIWLRQRGSTESKSMDEPDIPSDKESHVRTGSTAESPLWARTGGWRTAVFSNSLLAVMLFFWLSSWAVQSVTGWRVYNDEQLLHHETLLSYGSYLGTGEFWNRSMQNWQSEFLAVASISIFSVYLRQRGSSQSKPVGAPHHGDTGDDPG